MNKLKKYYGIYVIYADNAVIGPYEINLSNGASMDNTSDKIRLEVAHNEAFDTKKKALEVMKGLPAPAVYTILEVYLNTEE